MSLLFLSSSLVQDHEKENEGSEMKNGHAQLYGMTAVTPASIAYIASQILFALSAQSSFHKHNRSLNAVTFYNSILMHFNEPIFHVANIELLKWWYLQIFPRCKFASQTDSSSFNQRMKAAFIQSQNPSSPAGSQVSAQFDET